MSAAGYLGVSGGGEDEKSHYRGGEGSSSEQSIELHFNSPASAPPVEVSTGSQVQDEAQEDMAALSASSVLAHLGVAAGDSY